MREGDVNNAILAVWGGCAQFILCAAFGGYFAGLGAMWICYALGMDYLVQRDGMSAQDMKTGDVSGGSGNGNAEPDADAIARRDAREERRARNKAAWAIRRREEALARCESNGHTRGYKRGIKECARCGAEPKPNETHEDVGVDIRLPVVDEDAVAAVDGGLSVDKESASDED